MGGVIRIRIQWTGALALAALGAGMLAPPARAARFDCTRANTKVEHMICANSARSTLDEQMATAYRVAIRDGKNTDTMRKAQNAWLANRNGCAQRVRRNR